MKSNQYIMFTEFITVFCNLFICLRTDLHIHYSVHTLFLVVFLRCPITCHYVLSSVLWCPLRFPHINDVRFVIVSSCFLGARVLFALVLFVCVQWCPTHIVYVFVLFFFILCTLCCQILWICFFIVSSVVSNIYLNTQKLQCRIQVW